MAMQVGDIVESIKRAPYMITREGTQWIVYESPFLNEYGVNSIVIGSIPKSVTVFEERKKKYLPYTEKKGLGSYSRAKRMHTFQTYTVSPEYFKVVSKMGTNKEYAHLLSQGDMWEEEKPKAKYPNLNLWGNSYDVDNDDLPF